MRQLSFVVLVLAACFLATPALADTIPDPIAGDVVWTKANSPYIVNGVYVPAGSSLTIEPGTIVKSLSYRNAFDVDGTLTIGSEGGEEVIITSIKDDTVGGDTNGDLGATTPAAGDWRAISFNSGSTGTITNTTIRYGGATAYFSGNPTPFPLIKNNGGTLTLDHVTLAQSQNRAIEQTAGKVALTNSTIFDCFRGIESEGGELTTGDNTFTNVGDYSMLIYGTTRLVNNGGNTGDRGIYMAYTLSGAGVWGKDNLPYVVTGMPVPSGSSLTIMPGTIVKSLSYRNAFDVDGTLTIGREGGEEVIITSTKDDAVGGDTNGDLGATTPASGDWRAISFNSGSTGTITNTTIRYGGATQPIFGGQILHPAIRNEGGTLTLTHTTLTNNQNYGILQSAGATTILDSEIAHTDAYGIDVTGGTLSIHDSSIHDNGLYGVYNSAPDVLNARHNWWGHASGPTHPSSLFGAGDKVSDNVDFALWLIVEPQRSCTPGTEGCYSNVLFLPGIEASRLYDISNNEIWLPDDDIEADHLSMTDSGTSIHQDVTTQNAIDETRLGQAYTNIYKSFLAEMKTWKDVYRITATTTPYDWRLDYDTVVSMGRKLSNGHISYIVPLEIDHDPYIIETLKQLASTSRTGKVTIIAHSQGGLIAKALMRKLGTTTSAQLIDKVIFVAVPQLGTPQAIATLLNGTNAKIPNAISAQKVRQLAQNMQSAYNLLPSANYFTYVDDPTITIDSPSLPVWVQHYGDTIHWDGGMRNFMYDADVLRIKPTYVDLNTPEIVDPLKLLRAQEVHAALDTWVPPVGVQLTTIAGWGLETLSGIRYYRECELRNNAGSCTAYNDKITLEPQKVIDGDGTVVGPSALWADGAMSTRWWMNLEEYNKGFTIDRDHKNILEVPQVCSLIANIITGTTTSLQYISREVPQHLGNEPRLHFTLHSPLTLEFYDTLGNHVGFSTSTGQIDLNIPRVHYERYGEVQWLSIPKNIAGQLVMRGAGSGSFTLDVEEVNGNTILSTTSFEAIPSATNTIVTMNIAPTQSVTASSTLVIDEDGNGTTDLTLYAKVNAIVTLPPPFHFSGFLQPINDVAVNPSQGLSVFKGGSTIPVKFQLKNASGAPVQASSSPLWLAPQRLSTISAPVDESSFVGAGTSGNTFRWDSMNEQYVYNWSTKELVAGYWYRIYIKLEDETTQSVVVGVR